MPQHPVPLSVCHFFVDEAGDTTLFSARGRVLVGQPGCSKFFILGLCEIGLPDSLQADLDALRLDLLDDPYYRNVPSMQRDRGKTARAFHPKNDLPEVRREVFRLSAGRQDIRFLSIVRDKNALVSYVRQRNLLDSRFRYDQNSVYDELVRRLFRSAAQG
jgi:hypothetical protein